jgi:hypothetical protein
MVCQSYEDVLWLRCAHPTLDNHTLSILDGSGILKAMLSNMFY